MVIGFHTGQMNSESIGHNVQFLRTKVIKTAGVNTWNQEPSLVLPELDGVPELENSWGSNNLEVAAPVSAAMVEAGIPEGWCEDLDFVDELYRERQHPDYYQNQRGY